MALITSACQLHNSKQSSKHTRAHISGDVVAPALPQKHKRYPNHNSEANLVEVGCASLSRRVRLCMVHIPVPANEDPTLEDLHHLHGHIQGDGDEVAVQDEAGDEGVKTHQTWLVGVGGCLRPVWCQVPTTAKQG